MKKKSDEIYNEYKTQIDAIATHPRMTYSRAARIVTWFYGGSEDGWRRLLAKIPRGKTPKEVCDFLGQISKENDS